MNIHTRTAVEGIKRSPFQAISAVFILSLTFFVATIVSILLYGSNQLLYFFETRPQIIVFLKNDSSSENTALLQGKLTSDQRIKNVKYVSKEEALEIYKKATEDNPLLAELVSPSIFPASLEFSVTDLKLAESVISEVKNESIVDKVDFTANNGGEKTLSEVVVRLKTVSKYIRVGGLSFVSSLFLTSFFVLLVVISMRMSNRRNEMEILSLIGATQSFIKRPIIIESLIYSTLGVVIGFTLSFILFLFFAPSVLSYFAEIPVLPRDPSQFFLLFLTIFGLELVIGFVIALVGSLIAVKRSLKKTK